MEEIKQHVPHDEKRHEEHKPKKQPIGEHAKPTKFLVGGKTFDFSDFIGVTAETIKKRLAKADVQVTTAWAKAFHARINKSKKED